MRPNAVFAGFKEEPPRVRDAGAYLVERSAEMRRRFFERVRLVQNVPASELVMRIVPDVASGFDAVTIREPGAGRLAGDGANLVRGPDIKRAFAFDRRLRRVNDTVRILGGVESAPG